MNDAHYMQMALDLAEQGRGYTSPNPMVGALVVKNGIVLGRGYHQAAGGAHAEVHAIDAAGAAARGGTLYVNLEPCNHTGRTPPCTQKLLAAGIERVVIGMRDPNPTVTGGGVEFLEANGIQVTCGVCAEEAAALNEVFVKYIRTGRPFVTAKCAATLDGRIATRTGDSRWVSGEESRAFVHELRHAADAIMVGAGTVAADDPLLTTRLKGRAGKDPIRIVLDARLRTAPTARVLNHSSPADTILVAGAAAPAPAGTRMPMKGVRVIQAETREGRIDLDRLMDQLGQMGVTSILIEGGSRVLGSAFRAGIVDKACFFYAPLISGGDDGLPICSGAGAEMMRDCHRLDRIRIRRFGDDVMIEGYVIRKHSSGRETGAT
jgi:diaminohydroxyphosphoribosylaminopyrimidine deaminase/5-amino-6-(5-phosphoribosylamino)uracil reductase